MAATHVKLLLAAVAGLALAACSPPSPKMETPPASLIPVETFTLKNGLRVVFNIDTSDPVAAVLLAVHAGSARETPHRTGFAHMFEHLFFLNSENLGPGGLDKLTARVGGSGANGFTNNDQTIYLQTVPNDALEKMIWAEADKLGYFINTVTPAVLEKEKQVVKNEKRQSYDNQPYGHLWPVTEAALFPEDHPYNWPVIGSLADLDAAQLDDVKAFHSRWYVPNNATLVISGDFDPATARTWVEKYFSDIPRGADVQRPPVRPAALKDTRKLVHEDNFATLPQLTLTFAGPEAFAKDFWPVVMLADILAEGQEAPLNKVIVEDQKLAGEVQVALNDGQIAGSISINIRAFDGVDLDKVQAALNAGFAKFEQEGVKPDALTRVKAVQEANFYGQIGTVLDKAATIARYDGLLGNPAFADEDLSRLKAVTADDVLRVYQTYLKGKPHIAASFVPKGKAALALEGSEKAVVVEEPIVQGAEAPVDAARDRVEVPKTASSFDRSVEPPYGAAPAVKPPVPWTASLSNGLAVSGVEDRELPIVRFELALDGGRQRETPAQLGLANVTAQMLTRGTKSKTRADFENALKLLGARISVGAGEERLVVSGATLARNFAPTMALVQEMLLEPRWDPAELELVKAAVVADLQDERAQPPIVADRVLSQLVWGKGHVLAGSPLGATATVTAIKPEDLAAFHTGQMAPASSRFRVAGAVSQTDVETALADLARRWSAPVARAGVAQARPATPPETRVTFYDIPGAKQSMLIMASQGPPRADADFYPATAMNFILGGGGFASRLTQQLREGKGYTYGVRSAFLGGKATGQFRVSSPVRSNVTLEAATLMRDIVRDFGATFTEADLELTKSSLAKSRARAFEALDAKLGMLATIGDYGLPVDYVAKESAALAGLTLAQVKALAARYITPANMFFVVVGDAKTQAARLSALGYGKPVMATLDMK